MFGVLDKKLMRDTVRLYAQIIAISLVMACGVATIIIGVGAYRSLDETRQAFYDRYRFANVFSSAVRAPLNLREKIRAIPGVSGIELRIVKPVLLDIRGMNEPGTAMLVSIPDIGEPVVNRLYLRKGRFPETGRHNEVAVVEGFADAHGFELGNTFQAIMGGQKQTLKIVGIVLSPEYIYSIGPGDMVPDPRRFATIFMSNKTASGLFDMEGAFNDVALTTLTGTNERKVVQDLDKILKPFGSAGAYKREDQVSHLFLDAELTQLYSMARIIPPIFLLVSAFLVNMILSRIISLEREQIGLLKAVGYSNLAVGWHYAKLVIVVALIGLVIGSAAGTWLGEGLARLYSNFFSFPFLIFNRSLDLYAIAGGITVAAALAGAAKAIWSVATLPPAVAMRPPAPTSYRSIFGGLTGNITIFSQLTVMAFRHLVRHPVRNSLTVLGTSFSVALLVTALFSTDSLDHVIDTVFYQAERQHATLTFSDELGADAIDSIVKLPGVMRAEPFRAVPVLLKNGHFEERLQLTGVVEGAVLSRMLDLDLAPMNAPRRGMMLTELVASKLHAKPGDNIEVELLESGREIVPIPVVAIAAGNQLEKLADNPTFFGQPVIGVTQSYVGMKVYINLDMLNRVLEEGRRISGAHVLVDTKQLGALYEEVKQTPLIASIALQQISRDKFKETIDQNIQMMMTVYVVLAVIITFGVVYNSARIQLSERARELASLRVFGFTRAEVSSVLLTELGIIVLAAQPAGWALGFGFSWAVTKGFESEAFRVPLVINTATFAEATLVVMAAALVTAMLVRRRINNLDMIRVLKTRE